MAPRVLIVDDEPDVRAVAGLALETTGWGVSTAASGPESISIAAEEQPDVILMDMMMPEQDGIETCRQLQAQAETGGIPVILFTAKPMRADAEEFANLGIRGVIMKPFDPMGLAREIGRILDAPSGSWSSELK